MRYGSVCSGIEAATVAWHPLGWEPLWFSEIDPFACAVLAERWPHVPNLGDMTRIANAPAIDLLVGGTPCQSFSIAGLRGGLDDDRGNLALVFARLARDLRPRWVVWENVPGVLSSNGGRDFGSILGALADLGYGIAYRVLDAQFFGVPQRRRRVFVVGHLGDWRRAAAVLFERESLLGNPATRRTERHSAAGETGQGLANGREVSHCLAAHAAKGGDPTTDNYVVGFSSKDHGADAGHVSPTLRAGNHSGSHANAGCPPAIAFHHTQDPIHGPVSPALGSKTDGMGVCITGNVTHTLKAEGFDASEDWTGRGQPIIPTKGGPFGTWTYWPTTPAMGVSGLRRGGNPGGGAVPSLGSVAPTLERNHHGQAGILTEMRVRRLTPRECERLQGFPDDHTLIPYRGKPASDGPRYRAIGNSKAVPVVRWLGRRIAFVDGLEAAS